MKKTYRDLFWDSYSIRYGRPLLLCVFSMRSSFERQIFKWIFPKKFYCSGRIKTFSRRGSQLPFLQFPENLLRVSKFMIRRLIFENFVQSTSNDFRWFFFIIFKGRIANFYFLSNNFDWIHISPIFEHWMRSLIHTWEYFLLLLNKQNKISKYFWNEKISLQ